MQWFHTFMTELKALKLLGEGSSLQTYFVVPGLAKATKLFG